MYVFWPKLCLLTHEFKIKFKQCDKHVNNYQLSLTWIFVTAQVGNGPDNIAKEGIAGTDFNQSYEGFYDAKVGNQITEFRPIAGDIAKCPYGLFTNIQILEEKISEICNNFNFESISTCSKKVFALLQRISWTLSWALSNIGKTLLCFGQCFAFSFITEW